MIQVDRKQFSRALDLAAAVVASRWTIPILGNLKVSANGVLRLEGTDLDNWTCAEMPYTGDAGDFTLPQPRLVRSAINTAGGDTVSLKPDEGAAVRLEAGKLASDLGTLPADDFPFPDRVGIEEFGATLGAGELKQLKRVMAAISTEETRYYLNGVCVRHLSDWTYRFAATDGHRLLVVDIPLPDADGVIPNDTIIPRAWLNLVMARFARTKDGVRFSYGRTMVPNKEGPTLPLQAGGTRIAMRGDLDGIGFSVTGKLVDGKYPDYHRIIPTDLKYFARFRRADLVQAVHAVAALNIGKYRAVKLTFPKGKICCELVSADLGKSVFDIEAEHDVPKDVEHIGFNGRYLIDTLQALQGEEVVLQLNDSAGPALLTDPTDTAFKAVLMPTRV
ncbi:DNA polymerase III subunit beta [Novosphingobium resinovorum]|uniref:Beta sliding clamp n=1 Tax=Novosphingobium resinovorum TaxID=158500 RepID=A0A1D8A521_9SPHN|nr:DNA polymerase III subunit beta [Novosphingobium resinovorum]AOR77192.1 DNA polymerase III subunit beta [Novosphingobium resinovorum]